MDHLRRALAIEEAVGSEAALVLIKLSAALVGAGQAGEAVSLAERGMAIFQKQLDDGGIAERRSKRRLARAQFTLARALVAAKGDRRRALKLAGAARKVYAEYRYDDRVAEIKAWSARVRSRR